MKKILIIGRNSFIGKNIIESISQDNNNYEIQSISIREQSWRSESFQGFDAVVHLAAIVHKSEKKYSYDMYDKVNHQLTFELATKAKKEGVKQFVFLSTMSVYGLNVGHITAETAVNPVTFYGRSKLAAEQSIQNLSSEGFNIAIIRPPMVYGANNQGSFDTLTKIALFSPIFPKVVNKRSVIYVDNLSSFIKQVIEKDLQGILFPQNNEYMKTSETVALIAASHFKKVHLSNLLGLAIKPLMFSNTVQKAFGSLTYDSSLPGGPDNLKYNKLSFEDSIKQTARSYKSKLIPHSSMILQRPLDIAFSATGLVVASPLLIGATAIGYLDTGSPLFIQQRVGKDQKPFKLIKFRTMKVDTASVASHLADNSSITKLGKVLRKTKLDELPQLVNVLKGEMSLVGPRPNLFNQTDLIEAREQMGVYNVLPGITGLAQLSGIDMSTPEVLAKTDKEMIDNLTLKNYFSYIVRTALGKGSGDAVK